MLTGPSRCSDVCYHLTHYLGFLSRFLFVLVFETGSPYVFQASPNLVILLNTQGFGDLCNANMKGVTLLKAI